MAQVRLSIPPAPEQVRTVRLVAAAAARRCGVAAEALDDVRLAVGEATARAVARHVRTGQPDDVCVLLADEAHRFTVEVRDRVPAAAADAGDDALALALVEAVADLAEVIVAADGEALLLQWAIEPEPEPERPPAAPSDEGPAA